MRLLIDTHVFFWWMVEQERISERAHHEIADAATTVFVSIASAWEMAIKVGRGKWPEARRLVDQFEDEAESEAFQILPISVAHVRHAGLMASDHRDPFDRLLSAQATIEGLTLITADSKLVALGAPTLW